MNYSDLQPGDTLTMFTNDTDTYTLINKRFDDHEALPLIMTWFVHSQGKLMDVRFRRMQKLPLACHIFKAQS